MAALFPLPLAAVKETVDRKLFSVMASKKDITAFAYVDIKKGEQIG